jgi:hypothetical protein
MVCGGAEASYEAEAGGWGRSRSRSSSRSKQEQEQQRQQRRRPPPITVAPRNPSRFFCNPCRYSVQRHNRRKEGVDNAYIRTNQSQSWFKAIALKQQRVESVGT